VFWCNCFAEESELVKEEKRYDTVERCVCIIVQARTLSVLWRHFFRYFIVTFRKVFLNRTRTIKSIVYSDRHDNSLAINKRLLRKLQKYQGILFAAPCRPTCILCYDFNRSSQLLIKFRITSQTSNK